MLELIADCDHFFKKNITEIECTKDCNSMTLYIFFFILVLAMNTSLSFSFALLNYIVAHKLLITFIVFFNVNTG